MHPGHGIRYAMERSRGARAIRGGNDNLVIHFRDLFVPLNEGHEHCQHEVGEGWNGRSGPIFHSSSQSSNHFIRILVTVDSEVYVFQESQSCGDVGCRGPDDQHHG